jgi:hypothetical protein
MNLTMIYLFILAAALAMIITGFVFYLFLSLGFKGK